MRLAILLTATIKVQVTGGNFSEQERIDMYASTLRYYEKVVGHKYPVVFLENSDCDLGDFKREFESKLDIEFIQFNGEDSLPFDPSKGKGYNEYLMIGGAIEKSEKLKSCTHFLKITGRYAMLNIRSIIREVENRAGNKLFMGDVKDTRLYEMIGSKNFGRWGDSRYWVASVDYYKNEMRDCYKSMNDYINGMVAEDFILNMARKLKNDNRFIFRFRTQVFFNGVPGTYSSADLASGKYRQDSFGKRVKLIIRQCLRWLLPNVWF